MGVGSGGLAAQAAAQPVTGRRPCPPVPQLPCCPLHQVDESADFSKRCYEKSTWAASCSFNGQQGLPPFAGVGPFACPPNREAQLCPAEPTSPPATHTA